MQNSPKGIARPVPIPSGPPLLTRGAGFSCDPVPAARSKSRAGAGGAWQPIDAPMNGGSNDDLLRFLLVAAFLLAIAALLIVVALLVRQP